MMYDLLDNLLDHLRLLVLNACGYLLLLILVFLTTAVAR